ncbi:STM4012 family radical SAM protein [Allonocardiopsis opalescens]|uniref:Heme chaperone HemW n=1 Tax=Allonocardiopsis opalescens TaxID=1144618 RepID=A0A2T0PU79_9ACTN|nr:STM4012 family radical SAM protein [Allonocardiopsis opalescens]PRX92462.1 oxygen-independent coproporphyrinogen-3 oxidase [Allonocardiopsis opalescens]
MTLPLADGRTAAETDPDSPYRHYVYAYPHKTAYERLPEQPALAEVWAAEPTGALALYLHIPFCEMRCGFCNLFTRALPPAETVTRYLDALAREAEAVRAALPGAAFARAALGGGTPTYLSAAELHRVYDLAEQVSGTELSALPVSVETSPATATPDRLEVLAARGATRISIGVQSFTDAEAHAAGRPQHRAEVDRALAAIRAHAPAAGLNIDLIYGMAGQTAAGWRYSLDTALEWNPEELYLYPLYVRPKTGLAHRGAEWDDQRLRRYHEGREHLLAAGYRQVSMRMFRRAELPPDEGPAYCCQTDGMVGLGCGARSYTAGLHYSHDYAVSVREVRTILDDYLARPSFERVERGFRLDTGERRRRHLLQSLLQAEGVALAAYRGRFGGDPREHFATEFAELRARGWLAAERAGRLALTETGLAYSDTVGPMFFSPLVRQRMEGHTVR